MRFRMKSDLLKNLVKDSGESLKNLGIKISIMSIVEELSAATLRLCLPISFVKNCELRHCTSARQSGI